MSAVGATFGKAVGALGGPQLAAILVAGGLVAGALTGGLIAGPLSSGVGGTSTGQLSIYACPGVGPALQTVPAGQRFLVTGRSEDGTWARIHYPQPGRAEAWVQVSPLTFQASLDSVPVATCAPVVAIAGPSFGPGSTLTAIQDNSPSPGPTPAPTGTPRPTPTPDPEADSEADPQAHSEADPQADAEARHLSECAAGRARSFNANRSGRNAAPAASAGLDSRCIHLDHRHRCQSGLRWITVACVTIRTDPPVLPGCRTPRKSRHLLAHRSRRQAQLPPG